jgi:REP element-mobilizing transposase RayT
LSDSVNRLSSTFRYSTRRLRHGRISAPGEIYLLTAVTRCRTPVFSDFSSARCVVRGIAACRNDAATLCFVVMPDHFHWLVQLGDSLELRQLMAKAKAHSTRLLKSIGGPTDSIWQDGFHDYRLRPLDDPRPIARYVIRNPVRGGLVDSVGTYSHWDATWL